ncbi:MAG: class flavin-dependent oxidoreductase [Conexibacter sp.]|nr:class flavin-dependent oxidoreductase [Conexibacter sp.]
MRAGVFLAYWPWFSPAEQVELAVLADGLGLDSVWVAEAWGQDAVSVLGLLAGRTQRVGLGSGLLQIPARKPTATAMAAATLDVLSEGRFRLGLGLSGPQVSEGWYGVPFTRNLARTREYVDVVRRTLAREPIQLPLEGGDDPDHPPTGLGKPLKLLTRPVQDPLPIYLGAIGPRAVRQAGAIADGWLPFLLNPAEPEVLMGPLREGAQEAGRSLAQIDVAPVVPVAIDEDRGAARDAVRPWLAFYLGAMGAKEKNFYVDLAERHGHGASARAVQDLMLGGDRAGAAAAVTDALVDAGAIATTPSGLDERMATYERAGVTTLVAVPCGEDRAGVVRALAAATVTL